MKLNPLQRMRGYCCAEHEKAGSFSCDDGQLNTERNILAELEALRGENNHVEIGKLDFSMKNDRM